MTFGEDASLIRLRNAAQNFSFLRRVALNLFRADNPRSISLQKSSRPAAYNPPIWLPLCNYGRFDAPALGTARVMRPAAGRPEMERALIARRWRWRLPCGGSGTALVSDGGRRRIG